MREFNLRQAKAALVVFVLFGFCSVFIVQALAQGNGKDIETKLINPETESSKPNEPEYVPGELIVKLKEGKTLQDIQELNTKYNVSSTEKVFKEAPSPEDTLKQLKNKLSQLGTEHNKWYWQTDKNSQEYRNYVVRIEKEKEQLQKQIEAQEKLIERLEQRQKRAPRGVASPNLENIYLLKAARDINIISVAQKYKANENVEYAEPNYIARENAIPNDPYFSSSNSWGQGYDDLWNLKKIEADKAWDMCQGEGVIVAVVDSGIDYNHPDIAGNIWKNAGEIPNNGIDDDENSYVDDEKGWDFIDKDSSNPKEDNNPMDGRGHGTHVAGIIAAIGNNNIGVIGVAPKAKVMAVKGLADNTGGASTDILARCISYAVNNGADIINNSWGASLNGTLTDAIIDAYARGCILTFAVNNSRADIARDPLNSRAEIITVGSTDHNDKKSDTSNWGFRLDLASPGGDTRDSTEPANEPSKNILSLRAKGTGEDIYSLGTDYIRKSGTSMACPHVSGVAALLLSSNPDLKRKNGEGKVEEIRQMLRLSSDDIEEAGFDVKTGFGRVNAYKALTIGPVLETRITSPLSLTLEGPTSSIPITGIADGKYFSSYQLFVAPSSNLTNVNNLNWLTITGAKYAPVNNGILGTLNTKDLPTGLYVLRLQTKDILGMQFEDYLPVSLEKNPLRMIAAEGWYIYANFYPGPIISGKRIVWSSWRNANPESSNLDERDNLDIYLYDLANNQEKQITSRLGQEYNADISGNFIVYESWEGRGENYSRGRHHIYLYDLSTETEEKIAEGTDPVVISGNKIAWRGADTIHLYDISLKKELPVIFAEGLLGISGNYVVGWDDSTLYSYNLTTGEKRLITAYEKYTQKSGPAISGSRIVWSEERGGNWGIYLYDLTTNTERHITTITTNIFELEKPAISGDYIVWKDKRNGNWDIFLYDLKTNTGQQITANIWTQENPDISGRNIAWVDQRNGQKDIYTTELPDITPPTILHTPVTVTASPRPPRLISFTATITDADSGVAEAAVYWSRLNRVLVRERWGIKRWVSRWSPLYKLPMAKTGDNTYKANLSSFALLNSSVRYFISAKDKAGNLASTKTYEIR